MADGAHGTAREAWESARRTQLAVARLACVQIERPKGADRLASQVFVTPRLQRTFTSRGCLVGCEPVHTSGRKSNAFSNGKIDPCAAYPTVPQLRRAAMKHSMKMLLAIVAFGAVLAAPAFARRAQAPDASGDAQTYSHRTTVPAKCMIDEGNGRYTPCDAF
jgi:hypothetical protein